MRTRTRTIITATLTVGLVLAVPLSASAHVHVDPDQSTPGADDLRLTFTVPNESATAVTTGVTVDLPTTTPLAEVDYLPVEGWTGKVVTGALPKPAKVDGTTVTEAPLRVEWTADDAAHAIHDGQIQEFVVTAGPIPDTAKVEFPTEQTYSDGTVVRWNQPTPASGDEPEHPVPTLYVTERAPGATADASAAPSVAATSTPGSDAAGGTAIALSTAALIVAVAAAALAVGAFLRRRSSR